MAELQRLKTEFSTDPVSVGYGAWATVADDIRVQGLLHDPTKRPLSRVLVQSFLVVNAIDPTEFLTLIAVQVARLNVVLAGGQVDMASSTVRDIVRDIFPVGGPTRTALVTLFNAQNRFQSRAQEINLGGTVSDVTAARLLP